MKINLPKWGRPLFNPKRYKVLYGGRGSAKSHTVAKALLILARQSRKRILCAREFQNSMADSVHKLLSDQIELLGMQDFFTITANGIIGNNGSEFIFKGVKTNVQSIKSMEKIDILWLEEAQTVSAESWDILIPTIRHDGSEIWVTFNPVNDDDPTFTRFINPDGTPIEREDVYIKKVNWRDNPWFPEVLKREMEYQYQVDPELAMHIWEGECKSNSEAQIFHGKWIVQDFDIDQENWLGPYDGADWGFSVDPSTLIELWIDPVGMNLHIAYEAGGVGIELDDLPAMYDKIESARNTKIRADNSRPETISHMQKKGFDVEGARKWEGSVEDGIEFIRSFRKVIIHSRCPNTAKEFRKYSYKVDRLTGDVTTKIVDAWNHYIDAIRYALEPMIGAGGRSILDVL